MGSIQIMTRYSILHENIERYSLCGSETNPSYSASLRRKVIHSSEIPKLCNNENDLELTIFFSGKSDAQFKLEYAVELSDHPI